MHIIAQLGNDYVLRLQKGEELMDTIAQFCRDNDITGAFFHGLGAAREVTLGYYNPRTQVYDNHTFAEEEGDSLELASLNGNVAEKEGGELFVHAHACFAAQDKSAIAGHIQRATVSATCEIWLTVVDNGLTRTHDSDTDLHLLSSR